MGQSNNTQSNRWPLFFDNRLTIGNLITIATMLLGFVSAIVTYQRNVDEGMKRMDTIEQRHHVLESRVDMLEKRTDDTKIQLDKMQMDIDRSVTYLQLLLEKNGIHYVK